MSICSTGSGLNPKVSKWPAFLASVLAGATTKDLTWAGVALGFCRRYAEGVGG